MELYEKLRSSLLESHKAEMEELDRRFVGEPVNGSVRGYIKKERSGEIKKTIIKVSQDFSHEFRTHELLEALRSKDRGLWSRVRKSRSVGPTLQNLWKDGVLQKKFDNTGNCLWKYKGNGVNGATA